MKKIIFFIFYFSFVKISQAADEYAGLLWWHNKTVEDIRNWNFHLSDFPDMIRFLIDLFLGLAWTISLIFIIIWSYQIIFGSLSDNKTKWKETVMMALAWLALAALSWFIVKFVLENIS